MTDRAISTVVDVSMALLLISASLIVLGVFLLDGQPEQNRLEGERVANTLSSTTATANYTLAPVTTDPAFPGSGYAPATLERQRYGTAASLLADAAVTSVRIDGQPLTRERIDFNDSVRGNVRDLLTGIETDARVVALWRPFDGASIQGNVTAGPQLPGDADVQTATVTVSSGVPAVNESRVEAAFGPSGDFEAVADLIADAMVRGYFPPAASQLELERDRFERDLLVYRYRRLASIVSSEADPNLDATDPTNPLSRRGADATAVNDRLVDGLAEIVEADLRSTFEPDVSGETLAEAVSTDEVTLTVYVWQR